MALTAYTKQEIGEATPLPEATGPLGEKGQWLVDVIDGMYGRPVTNAQLQILPWTSATFVVVDGMGRELARGSLRINNGHFEKTAEKTEATVRVTEAGIEELRPFILKFAAGPPLTARERAEAGAKIAVLRLRREVAF